MNSDKNRWSLWAVFLILLTGCKEMHGVISFEKNGSGIFNLKIVYARGQDSEIKVTSQ
jgi:hypothetical protein